MCTGLEECQLAELPEPMTAKAFPSLPAPALQLQWTALYFLPGLCRGVIIGILCIQTQSRAYRGSKMQPRAEEFWSKPGSNLSPHFYYYSTEHGGKTDLGCLEKGLLHAIVICLSNTKCLEKEKKIRWKKPWIFSAQAHLESVNPFYDSKNLGLPERSLAIEELRRKMK